jgi:lipoprotein-releasing system ATP-binding protein
VLADEPSGNLDSYNSEKLYDLMLELSRTYHTSFVIATHNTQYAMLSDRCLQMKDGQLSAFSRSVITET